MTQNGQTTPVSVLGLGSMGAALARAFLAAGHPTTVWNRTPERADALVAAGAVRAGTPAAAAGASPLVVLCLFDAAATRAVLDAAGERLAGRTVVDLTTGTPEQARAAAARVTGLGARHLDGKILAVPAVVGDPGATLFFSGDAAAHREYADALRALGTGHYLGSDPGQAARYDLALLGIMWSTLAGFYHAAALLRAEQIEAGAFTPLAAEWLRAVAELLPGEARDIDARDYATDVSSTVALNAAGIELLVQASRDAGVEPAVPASIQRLLERRLADGHGAESVAGLTELIANPR